MSLRFSFFTEHNENSDFSLRRGTLPSETICLIGLGISGCLHEGSLYLFHIDSVWVNTRTVGLLPLSLCYNLDGFQES